MPIYSQIQGEHAEIKFWTPIAEVEDEAIKQLKNMAQLPFVFKHISVMPDVHLGKGATVGSVIATKDAIVPACVGVDIGCGMMAIQIDLAVDIILNRSKEIRYAIEKVIPLGFHEHRQIQSSVFAWKGWQEHSQRMDNNLLKKAQKQLASLGGGNHFIECCTDQSNQLWLVCHSGSRHIGNALAMFHIHKAKSLLKQMAIKLPDPDLAWFVSGTMEFKEYWEDLKWCQEYAFQNRIEMMKRIIQAIKDLLKLDSIHIIQSVNCHHNYIQEEFHFGEDVYVTRKGAVSARLNELGIIPGSMGARSYIVKGLGNTQSFQSCSHGAGRRLSRTKAKKQFSVQDLVELTSGIECRKDAGVLDEIPTAYKNIEKVMNYQSDLVEIIAELKQIICIKG